MNTLRSAVLSFLLFAGPCGLAQETDPLRSFLDSKTASVSWLDLSTPKKGVDEFYTFMGLRVPGLRKVGEGTMDEVARLRTLGVSQLAFIYAEKRYLNSSPCLVLVSSKATELKSEISTTPLPEHFEVMIKDGIVLVGHKSHLESLLRKDGDIPGWLTVSESAAESRTGMICMGAALLAADSGFRLRKFASSPKVDFELAAATLRIEHVRFSMNAFPEDADIRITTRRAEDVNAIVDLLKRELAAGIPEYQLTWTSSISDRTISLHPADGEQTRRLLRRIFRLPSMDRSAAMTDRLKKIAIELHNYHEVNDAFPPQSIVDKNGRKLLSWRVLILPYLGHFELYTKFRLDEPWDSEWNSKLIAEMPDVFRPVESIDIQPGQTDLMAPLSENSLFGRRGLPCKLQDISDGMSNTLMVISAPAGKTTVWTKPEDLIVNTNTPTESFFGPNQDSFWCSICDGSVRLVPRTVTEETLKALLSIDGKEAITPLP